MNLDSYKEIEKAGGFGKPEPRHKRKGVVHFNNTLKSYPSETAIPLKVKIETLAAKGCLCFMGFCENCGGTAHVTLDDDFHHFPHKGPHSTPDDKNYLWPSKRDCHTYYQTHPREERELFKRIEAAKLEKAPVYWTVPKKIVGATEERKN